MLSDLSTVVDVIAWFNSLICIFFLITYLLIFMLQMDRLGPKRVFNVGILLAGGMSVLFG